LDLRDIGGRVILAGEKPAGEIGASLNVNGSEFGAGAGGIAAMLQVSGVVEEDGDEAQADGAGVEVGFGVGLVPALEEEGEAEGALEGVLQVMVAGVEGFEIGVGTGESVSNPAESAGNPFGVGFARDRLPRLNADDENLPGFPGVRGGKHARR